MIQLTDEEADVLRRLLRAVGGVVPEFIIAGGQAARLLRLHPLAARLQWSPLLTSDTDVATVDKGHRGNNLAKALETEGFTPTLSPTGAISRHLPSRWSMAEPDSGFDQQPPQICSTSPDRSTFEDRNWLKPNDRAHKLDEMVATAERSEVFG